MKKVYWWLFIVRLSFKWCWRFNLGDRVWFSGEKCTLIQGVCAPAWDLKAPNGDRLDHIHKSKLRKSWTPANLLHSWRSGYRFYMTSWFQIWGNEGIKPWMRACKIWAKPNM